jgi:methionyl-tRNA synthetase
MNIDQFNQLGLRIGKIVAVESVASSDKLLKFQVDIGDIAPRQILSGVAKVYAPSTLIGKTVIVAVNIDSRPIAGAESIGMLIGIERDYNGNPRLIFPDDDLPAGTIIS